MPTSKTPSTQPSSQGSIAPSQFTSSSPSPESSEKPTEAPESSETPTETPESSETPTETPESSEKPTYAPSPQATSLQPSEAPSQQATSQQQPSEKPRRSEAPSPHATSLQPSSEAPSPQVTSLQPQSLEETMSEVASTPPSTSDPKASSQTILVDTSTDPVIDTNGIIGYDHSYDSEKGVHSILFLYDFGNIPSVRLFAASFDQNADLTGSSCFSSGQATEYDLWPPGIVGQITDTNQGDGVNVTFKFDYPAIDKVIQDDLETSQDEVPYMFQELDPVGSFMAQFCLVFSIENDSKVQVGMQELEVRFTSTMNAEVQLGEALQLESIHPIDSLETEKKIGVRAYLCNVMNGNQLLDQKVRIGQPMGMCVESTDKRISYVDGLESFFFYVEDQDGGTAIFQNVFVDSKAIGLANVVENDAVGPSLFAFQFYLLSSMYDIARQAGGVHGSGKAILALTDNGDTVLRGRRQARQETEDVLFSINFEVLPPLDGEEDDSSSPGLRHLTLLSSLVVSTLLMITSM